MMLPYFSRKTEAKLKLTECLLVAAREVLQWLKEREHDMASQEEVITELTKNLECSDHLLAWASPQDI